MNESTTALLEPDMALNDFEGVTPEVPATSAGGRYDDGVAEISPEEFEAEQAEANRQRLANIAKEEQRLAELRGVYRAGAKDKPKFVHRLSGPAPLPDRLAWDQDDAKVDPSPASAAPTAATADDESTPQTATAASERVEQSAGDASGVGVGIGGRYARRVRCVTDNKTFPSIAAAARAAHTSAPSLANFIAAGRTLHGKRYEWIDAGSQPKTPTVMADATPIVPTPSTAPDVHPPSQRVRCTTTDQIFESAQLAGEKFGVTDTSIRNAIWKGQAIEGIRFEWVEKPAGERAPKAARCAATNTRRAVRRLDTGQVYDGVKSAARQIGVNPSSLVEALKRGTRCAYTKWEYADGRPATPKPAHVPKNQQPTVVDEPALAVGSDDAFIADTLMAIGRSGAAVDGRAAMARVRELAIAKSQIDALMRGDVSSLTASLGGKAATL